MSNQTQWKKYNVGGVDVDAVTIAGATDYIIRRAMNQTQPAAYVVKPYSEFIDAVARDPQLLSYLNESELCLPDGIALCWATVYRYGGKQSLLRIITTGASIVLRPKSAYQFLPEKFAGANATSALLESAATSGAKVFLIGAPHGTTISRTADVMRTLHPDLKIVGTSSGDINGLHGSALRSALETGLDISPLAKLITAANPDIILVGMGFPLQEILMHRLVPEVSHGILIGEGGTFDYKLFGGSQARAPKFVQATGLEWLWRLILQPKRIVRQLAIPRLIWRLYREPRP